MAEQELTIHQRVLAEINNRLLIAMLRRLTPLGEELVISAEELEATTYDMLILRWTPDRSRYFFHVERMPDESHAPVGSDAGQ